MTNDQFPISNEIPISNELKLEIEQLDIHWDLVIG